MPLGNKKGTDHIQFSKAGTVQIKDLLNRLVGCILSVQHSESTTSSYSEAKGGWKVISGSVGGVEPLERRNREAIKYLVCDSASAVQVCHPDN